MVQTNQHQPVGTKKNAYENAKGKQALSSGSPGVGVDGGKCANNA
jgi:hypothetical protein